MNESLNELDRCLLIFPFNYKLLCNKGFLLNEMGRQREAKEYLIKALDNNPRDEHSWNNLGNSHYELGEFGKALFAYSKAIEISPTFYLALNNSWRTDRIIRHHQNHNIDVFSPNRDKSKA